MAVWEHAARGRQDTSAKGPPERAGGDKHDF